MASTGEVWKLGHRPALDGVRGVAVLLVVGYHSAPGTFGTGGVLGVSLFFVLSGFLIAAMLTAERARTGVVDLRGFAARRARRLVPALVPLVAVAVASAAVVHPQFATWPWVAGTFLYVSNWVALAVPGASFGLGHTWSLGIEGQFYLLLPLLVVRLRGRSLLVVLAGLTLGSLTLRLALAATAAPERFYYGTDTNIGILLAGALLGVTAARTWRPPAWLVAAVVVLLVGLAFLPDSATMQAVAVLPAIGAGVVLVAASNRPPGWLTAEWVRYVGRRSYGLYLWHFPLLWLAMELPTSRPVQVVVAWLGTLLLAELSWRFVESPLVRAGKRARAYTPSSQESMVSPIP